MAKILRVNMSSLKVSEEAVPQAYQGLGGRALTSTVVLAEVPPTCHPLGKNNKLVIAPGLLGGTAAPVSGRLSVGGKSPLTGGIKESNAGGTAAHLLARMGITALIVEGRPQEDRLYQLVITPQGAELRPADGLRGLGNYDTVGRLVQEFGDKVSCITIGQAGEMRLLAASIAVTDRENRPTRHAGRGGLGAVMGSKGLKAILIDAAGTGNVSLSNPEAFREACRKFAKVLQEHPVTSQGLPTYGTNILANIMNEAGGYPTRNFSEGQFEGTHKISGEAQLEVIQQRGGVPKHACHVGCIIACSRIYVDKDGNYLTKGPEYETIWAHGANCGIDDLDAIARMDRLEDDFGLDTIEIGATLGVAMEAGNPQFGDAAGAIERVEEIGRGTPLGRILGSGAAVTGQVFGVERVPVVKGQAMPAYDPRAVKGIGVTYATSTMGADHTAGYSVAANILGVGGQVNPLAPEGQVELSRNLQVATAAVDSTGLCLFVAFAILDNPEGLEAVCQMIGAKGGTALTPQDVTALGQHVLKVEREFNQKAGLTALDDRLPAFFQEERLKPHDALFDVPDAELDTLFNF
ncbi:MAG: aldehyde ferredoxin oxidoreductase [Candidatus Tectomicrobia bacterium]|uniref:Aldehyde ferredoxin oxidoreductase n=1 Tax=Tectimicrobiota bacterium TaxID=2528274 RepID=A0A932FXL0_UNCTE|nr:aldehyde ferredoxin oxidoreductase [Candidatus Tectomicrobia bacterium]